MKSTQTDKGLTFDGAAVVSAPRVNKYQGNQHAGVQDANKTINKGRGPTTGNTGSLNAGPAKPPAGSVPTLPKQGSVRDNINRGAQVRTPGGTRAWEPRCENNYRGNMDRINEGRGPTRGNSQ
jgi:hypothetical protein